MDRKDEIITNFFDKDILQQVECEIFDVRNIMREALEEYASLFATDFLKFVMDNYRLDNYNEHSIIKTWSNKPGITYTPEELFEQFKKNI